MRGINLGCGRLTMPQVEKPAHQQTLPDALFADGITWDNLDWNEAPGVNIVADLFDYPWRTDAGELPKNTYDVAILSHVAEHIPHHIIERGEFVHRHPVYQDGWFAFFGSLHHIMKPSGKAYVLSPFAFCGGGVSDPTHTRYLTPASFGYLQASEDAATFAYRTGQNWHAQVIGVSPGAITLAQVESTPHQDAINWWDWMWHQSQSRLNVIADFTVELVALK